MKTKFLLFLAVLGMGMGFFACEKEGEDAVEVSSSAESELKTLEKAYNDFSKYFEEADKKNDGRLKAFFKSFQGDPASFHNNKELQTMVDVTKLEAYVKNFANAYQKVMSNPLIASKTPLTDLNIENHFSKSEKSSNSVVDDGLPCTDQYIADAEHAENQFVTCVGPNFTSFPSWIACAMSYSESINFAFADYKRCLRANY
jgi:hypothetical protein